MAYLIIHVPNQPRQRAMLGESTIVGRAFGSNVWFEDARLSRRHCVIRQQGEQLVLIDENSTNGTYVNSQRVERRILADGDIIEIGDVRMVFQEGRFVENRPADPIDAAMTSQGQISIDPTVLSNETVVGEPSFRRPLPVPQPNCSPQQREMPAIPLAFTRPPAKPIVDSRVSDDATRSSRWMDVLMSHVLGS